MAVVKEKVCRNGNSATVTLPVGWRRRTGVEVGDVVELSYGTDGILIITPSARADDRRGAALAELLSEVDRTPSVPWSDDSPEADRKLLAGRYA